MIFAIFPEVILKANNILKCGKDFMIDWAIIMLKLLKSWSCKKNLSSDRALWSYITIIYIIQLNVVMFSKDQKFIIEPIFN